MGINIPYGFVLGNNTGFGKIKPMNYEKMLRHITVKHFPKSDYRVFLFGSRAGGKHKESSDYDVGVIERHGQRVSLSALSKIENELEQNYFPFKVDIVDFSNVSEQFKNLALKCIKKWS